MMVDLPPLGDNVPEWASDAIRHFCGWHIAPEITETVRVYPNGNSTIILPSLKVADVLSVTIDGTEVQGYDWEPSGILYLNRRMWSARHPKVEVTMKHGWPTLPPAIFQAAQRMDMIMGGMPFSYMNVDGVSVGRVGKPGNQSSTTGLDDVTALILSPYVWGQLP